MSSTRGSARPRQAPLVTVLALLALLVPVAGVALDTADADLRHACPPDEVPDRFADVGPPHGHAANCLAWHGIAQGRTATTYDPNAPVTRAQTASLLYRLLQLLDGIELPERDRGAFPDVDGGPHVEAIETLTAIDPPVIRGYEDGTFGPQDRATRGQIATIVVLALDEVARQVDELEPLPAATSPYQDTAGSVHEDRIARLSEAGIVRGFEDGTFRPSRPVTRGQLASMLARGMGALADAGVLEVPPADPVEPHDPDLTVALRLTQVASMSSPTAGSVGPDGTLYLAERAGTVHPLTADGLGAAVVDLSAETTTDGERGLLGLAFAANGSELYLSFTDLAGDTQVDAVAVDGGAIDADDRRTVFTLDQPHANHNGGDIQIGPDGMLYLGLGDGGGSGDPDGHGQDTSTLHGSLLRIDPQAGDPYAIPDDNPFIGDPDAADEIYAYGLRNPWRFSFDHVTDRLWIADVGQSHREEVNVGHYREVAGANYGWNLMEGTREFAGSEPDDHVPPVYEYETRGEIGCAVTGGYVYRGRAIPELVGAYLFSDYCGGGLHALVVDDDGQLVETGDLSVSGEQVVSFARDADGELYLLDFGGAVHRIDPA
jgi:glucose/arabinose dehydrogenase